MTATTTAWPMPHNTTIINEINRVMAPYAQCACDLNTLVHCNLYSHLPTKMFVSNKGLNNCKTNFTDHEPMLEVLQGLLRPLHLQRTCTFCLLPLLSHAIHSSISCLRLSSSTIQPLVYFTIHPSLSSIHFYHSQICCSYHSPICHYCYHIGEEMCAATTVANRRGDMCDHYCYHTGEEICAATTTMYALTTVTT
jgi:hypothetical protein